MSVNFKKKQYHFLNTLLKENPPPFALLYRPEANSSESVDVLFGEIYEHQSLSEITLPELEKPSTSLVQDKLVLMPYRQISERGLEATNDGTPLLSMDIQVQEIVNVKELMDALPDQKINMDNAGFDMDDPSYAAMVADVLEEEIGRGKGASFVLQRSFTADLSNYSIDGALSIFKKLLAQSGGAYWVFIVNTGERTLLGATPERHISVNEGTAIMNPISGTYRYPPTGPKLSEITTFLSDQKETEELYMVVDEELKMMARVCDSGGTVIGPNLKEMAKVAHTEYFIQGQTSMEPLEILRETMFAPSVTGSPQESAASVIHQYEPAGRGYYSGVMALIGQKNGMRVLDSGILIRTADINNNGHLRLAVGATLVRGSDPLAETEETKAKASGLLTAIGMGAQNSFSKHPSVVRLLQERNYSISDFWLKDRSKKSASSKALFGKKVLIVDAEDTFTLMIDHQLRSLGCSTLVKRFDEKYSFDDDYDLVVMGPGPGDPRDLGNTKIAHLHKNIKSLLSRQMPFLAVCLSHQILSSILGLNVVRRDDPNQGVQKEINLFGKNERVGFYNTFSARSNYDKLSLPNGRDLAEIALDPIGGEVHAIRSAGFTSIQFHPESILTMGGVKIFENILVSLLKQGEKEILEQSMNLVEVA
jgi:phenazine biosynthesis protein phzE